MRIAIIFFGFLWRLCILQKNLYCLQLRCWSMFFLAIFIILGGLLIGMSLIDFIEDESRLVIRSRQTAPPLGSLSGGGSFQVTDLWGKDLETRKWVWESYGDLVWCFRILQFQLLEKRVHRELPMEIDGNHWARVIAWCRFRGKFVLQSMPDHDSNISCWGTSYRATYTMFQAAVGWHWSSVRVSCEGLEH